MSKRVPEVIRGLSREQAPHFYKLNQKTPQPTAVEPGQIWSTYSYLNLPDLAETSTDEPRLVVILAGTGGLEARYEQVTTAPISLMLWAATDFDLIVPKGESPLAYQFMVEVWNETPTLKAHLKACLGKLSERAMTVLRSVHVARLVDENLPAAAKAWVGLPLMGDSDTRIAFQEAEIEALEYLAKAATTAVFAELTASVVADQPTKTRHRFEVKPIFGNLADFLKGPKRAFASSTLSQNDVIISKVEGDDTFVFELLERRRESRVYLVIHDLSASLEGKVCVVTLVTADTEIHSEPAEMHKGAEIQIGNISNFDKKKITRIEIEAE